MDAGSPRNSLPHRKNFVTGARAAVKRNPLAVRMSGAEGERHLLRILSLYSSYYNQTRTHLALSKDAPLGASRARIRSHYCHSNSVRIASSLCADMIFGKDKGKLQKPSPAQHHEHFRAAWRRTDGRSGGELAVDAEGLQKGDLTQFHFALG